MAFMVNATARTQIYVSSVSYGGIPVGSDANSDGSAASPFLTWDRSYSLAPVGGQILLNGNPASPPTYKSSTATTISKSLTVGAINALGAVLAGVDTTRALTIGGSGISVVLNDVVVDPSLNTGGAALRGIDFTTAASNYSATLNRCQLQNWVDYAYYNPDVSLNANITLNGCTTNGGNVKGGARMVNYGAGTFTVTGGTSTLTAQNSAGDGLFVITATADGVVANITNHTASVTVDPALTTGNTHYINRLTGVRGTISGGTYTAAASGSRGFSVLAIMHTSTRTIDGSSITGATVINNASNGIGILMGNDNASASRTMAPNCTVSNNVISGSAGGEAIVFGSTLDGVCTANTATGQIVIGAKDSGNFSCTLNTFSNVQGLGYVDKGNDNSTYSGNTATVSSAAGALLMYVEDNSDTGNHSLGAVITWNTFNVTGGTGTAYVNQQINNTATWTNNIYNKSGGTLDANPWQRLSVNYSTLAAWQVIEPTATGTAP